MAGYTFHYHNQSNRSTMKFFKDDVAVENFLKDNPGMFLAPVTEKKPFNRDDMPSLVSDRMIAEKQLSGDFKNLMGKMKKEAGRDSKMKEW